MLGAGGWLGRLSRCLVEKYGEVNSEEEIKRENVRQNEALYRWSSGDSRSHDSGAWRDHFELLALETSVGPACTQRRWAREPRSDFKCGLCLHW